MSDRASLRHGLPYRWWRNPDVWAAALCVPALALAVIILGAWFR